MSDQDVSISERYAKAIQAKNLKPNELRSGPLDVLAAVALSGDSLGSSLMRLRAEFDCLALEINGTGNNSLTDRLLVLMQLKTLDEVKEKLADLAVKQAVVKRFPGNQSDIFKIVGKVLDLYLDPNCWHCAGRGFDGGGRHEHTGPMMICRCCHGSGKRRREIGRGELERAFASHLMAIVEKAADRAESGARTQLRFGQ